MPGGRSMPPRRQRREHLGHREKPLRLRIEAFGEIRHGRDAVQQRVGSATGPQHLDEFPRLDPLRSRAERAPHGCHLTPQHRKPHVGRGIKPVDQPLPIPEGPRRHDRVHIGRSAQSRRPDHDRRRGGADVLKGLEPGQRRHDEHPLLRRNPPDVAVDGGIVVRAIRPRQRVPDQRRAAHDPDVQPVGWRPEDLHRALHAARAGHVHDLDPGTGILLEEWRDEARTLVVSAAGPERHDPADPGVAIEVGRRPARE